MRPVSCTIHSKQEIQLSESWNHSLRIEGNVNSQQKTSPPISIQRWPRAPRIAKSTSPDSSQSYGELQENGNGFLSAQTLLCVANGTERGYPARFDGHSNPSSTLLSTARRWPSLSFESALNYTPKEISQRHAAHVLQWVAAQALMQCCFWQMQDPGSARSPGKFHRPKGRGKKREEKKWKTAGEAKTKRGKKQSGWFVKVSCLKPCSTRSHSTACPYLFIRSIYIAAHLSYVILGSSRQWKTREKINK